jgi:uncharacterized protein (DUF58 family)
MPLVFISVNIVPLGSAVNLATLISCNIIPPCSAHIEQRYINRFSPLEILARQVVEGFITGLHKSPFHGFSVEFAEHRLYNQGESTRHIDWKLYGKTEKLFVKRYEEETNLRCQIIIDNSSSMYFPVLDQDYTREPKQSHLLSLLCSCYPSPAQTAT